ncbi:hypothetical protein BKA60DRAFT_528931, partial [Fusarium oxysporum]
MQPVSSRLQSLTPYSVHVPCHLAVLYDKRTMVELKTFEIWLPARTTNHSDPHLLCPPVSWENVVVFFLGNYITHAATVKLPPATPLLANIWICLGALLMPATGLVFGLLAFSQAIKGLKESELTKATVAGALCMYVRTSEWPPNGETIEVKATRGPHAPSSDVQPSNIIAKRLLKLRRLSKWFFKLRRLSKDCGLQALRPFMGAVAILFVYFVARLNDAELLFHLTRDAENETETEMSPRTSESRTMLLTTDTTRPYLSRVSPNASVHGLSYRHSGYDLVIVPDDAVIDPIRTVDDGVLPQAWGNDVHLAKSWNVAKGLVALLQFCFSLFVLIKAQGNQIEVYGYAAFSLTVAPYAVMAFVNLLANACMPTYTCHYLVKNDVLSEMEEVLRVKFDGVVGTVRHVDDNVNLSKMVRSENGSLHMISSGEDEEDTRLEVLTPEKAITRGIIPSQTVAIEECKKIELEARRPWLIVPLLIVGFLLVGAPVAIVGGMSKFRAGTESTPTQRGVLMAWLGAGQLFGLCLAGLIILTDFRFVRRVLDAIRLNTEFTLSDQLLRTLDIYDTYHSWKTHILFKIILWSVKACYYNFMWPIIILSMSKAPDISELLFYTGIALVYGVPAIWGFIIVGQMLKAYGNCIRIY